MGSRQAPGSVEGFVKAMEDLAQPGPEVQAAGCRALALLEPNAWDLPVDVITVPLNAAAP